jgi:hypothetical protein
MSEGRRRRTKKTNKKKVAQMSYLLDGTDHAEAFLSGLFGTLYQFPPSLCRLPVPFLESSEVPALGPGAFGLVSD